ncbi:MAG: GNAT family N-acetyltransferase [Oscillospiraceae bacterium]|nr:GNAT family N-acetyltransferase [Oscillospiraceae bacterium]
MDIRSARADDLDSLTRLGLQLWPDHEFEELRHDFAEIMAKPEAAFFLAVEKEQAVGFAQCQLRHDYVEGTESSPVGYLEGIFVKADHRGRGLAGRLLAACENWAREQNCREFASDCELHNTGSLRFHLNMGFEEAGRIICFKKKL